VSVTNSDQNDPEQMHNLFDDYGGARMSAFNIRARPFHQITQRLDALTLVLKNCKGIHCRHPWRHLHPNGRVETLTDALNPDHDQFYDAQPKVSFKECAKGYFPDLEGPTTAFVQDEPEYDRQQKVLANEEAGHPKYPGYWGLGPDNTHDDHELRRRTLEAFIDDRDSDFDLRMQAIDALQEDEDLDPFDDDLGTFLDGDWGIET
jgi:hypothetical protein